MSAPLREKFEQHLTKMVADEKTFTVGISEFYKSNGGKGRVWKELGLKKSWTWSKRLEFLFSGQFTIKQNRLYSINQEVVKIQSKIPKKTLPKNLNTKQKLGSHIENWIDRVVNFDGNPKKRSTPSSVKKNGLGSTCPTCRQQMVDKKGSPFKISAEHIIPLSMGGDNTVSGDFPQVVAMCHACNTARNQTVLAIKDSNKEAIVEFLIRQVYDPKSSNLHNEYFSLFQRYYFAITGMEVKLQGTGNDLLIVSGFIDNQPSPLMEIVVKNIKDIPRKIVLFVEQKDSKRISLKSWSKFTNDIRLVPNGKENIQCSVILESRKYQENSVVCLMNQSQSSGVFENLLDEMKVKLLDSSGLGVKTNNRSKFKISKILPWNWFARASKQIKSGPTNGDSTKSKPEVPPSSEIKGVIPFSKSETTTSEPSKQNILEKSVDIGSVKRPQLKEEIHTIEIFRNQIIEELKISNSTKLSMSEIRSIATEIKMKKKMSWRFFHAEFGLNKRIENWEEHFSTMLEMAGLEHTKESKEEVDWFHFSGNMLPLPGLENNQKDSVTKTEFSNPNRTEWASPEQQMIIDEVRESLIASIYKLEKKNKNFEMKHLGEIYKPYGGSLAFKKKMGLLSSTKIKDMFSKLFGDEFTFSGKKPLWVISHSNEYTGRPLESEE